MSFVEDFRIFFVNNGLSLLVFTLISRLTKLLFEYHTIRNFFDISVESFIFILISLETSSFASATAPHILSYFLSTITKGGTLLVYLLFTGISVFFPFQKHLAFSTRYPAVPINKLLSNIKIPCFVVKHFVCRNCPVRLAQLLPRSPMYPRQNYVNSSVLLLGEFCYHLSATADTADDVLLTLESSTLQRQE